MYHVSQLGFGIAIQEIEIILPIQCKCNSFTPLKIFFTQILNKMLLLHKYHCTTTESTSTRKTSTRQFKLNVPIKFRTITQLPGDSRCVCFIKSYDIKFAGGQQFYHSSIVVMYPRNVLIVNSKLRINQTTIAQVCINIIIILKLRCPKVNFTLIYTLYQILKTLYIIPTLQLTG